MILARHSQYVRKVHEARLAFCMHLKADDATTSALAALSAIAIFAVLKKFARLSGVVALFGAFATAIHFRFDNVGSIFAR